MDWPAPGGEAQSTKYQTEFSFVWLDSPKSLHLIRTQCLEGDITEKKVKITNVRLLLLCVQLRNLDRYTEITMVKARSTSLYN